MKTTLKSILSGILFFIAFGSTSQCLPYNPYQTPTISNITASGFTYSITDDPDCRDGWVPYVSSNPNFTSLIAPYNGTTKHRLVSNQITGLSGCGPFYIKVAAYKGTYITAPSPVQTVNMLPAINNATNITSTGFQATWPYLSWAAWYDIEVYTEYGTKVGPTITSCCHKVITISNPTCNAYKYRVRGVSSGGTMGCWSDFSATFNLIPPKPTVTVTDVTNSSFTINWNSVSCASEYVIDLYTNNSQIPGFPITVTGTSHTFSNLPYCAYSVGVKAKNGATYSPPLSTDITIHLPPTNLIGSPVTGNSFVANWNMLSSYCADWYDIEVFNTFGSKVGSTITNCCSGVLVTDLSCGGAVTDFKFRVRGVKNGVTGFWSAFSSTIYLNPTPYVSEATTGVNNNFSFNVSTGSSCPSPYVIDVAYDPGFTSHAPGYPKTIIQSGNWSHSYTLPYPYIDTECEYYYRVGSNMGNSTTTTWSNTGLGFVGNSVIVPTGLTISNVSLLGGYDVNWQPISCTGGNLLYRVRVQWHIAGHVDPGNPLYYNEYSTASTAIHIDIDPKNLCYYANVVSVRSTRGSVSSSYSSGEYVHTCSGYRELSNSANEFDGVTANTLSIYPNPISSTLSIQLSNSEVSDIDFRIFDSSGRILQFGNTSSDMPLDVSELSAGIYFINLQSGEYSKTERFIKQ